MKCPSVEATVQRQCTFLLCPRLDRITHKRERKAYPREAASAPCTPLRGLGLSSCGILESSSHLDQERSGSKTFANQGQLCPPRSLCQSPCSKG